MVEMSLKNTGKVQKRQDTKRGYQKGAGTTRHICRQNQKKKADVVRACNKDGGNQTTGSRAIRTSGENKKQRKTTKEVDGQCERRPNGTRNEHKRSGGQQQKPKDLY